MHIIFLFLIFISGAYPETTTLLPYTVEGTVAINNTGKTLYLYTFPTSLQTSLLVTVPIVNGQFKITGIINQEKGKYSIGRLFFYGETGLLKSGYARLTQSASFKYRDFVFESEVKITVDSLIERSTVSGGDFNKTYDQVNEIYLQYSIRLDSLKTLNAKPFKNKGKAVSQTKKTGGNYSAQIIELQDQRNAQLIKFVSENPSSPIAFDQLVFLTSLSDFQRRKFQQNLEEAEPLLPLEWLNSPKGKWVISRIHALKVYHRLKPGVIIPDFIFADEDTSVTVQEFKGNYLLLCFWTSWNADCRAEQIFLKEAYRKFQGKGFKILQVSMDVNNHNWKAALAEEGVQWKQARCKNGWDKQVEKTFEIYGLPANYLVDPQGRIVAINLKGNDLEKKLNEVLK